MPEFYTIFTRKITFPRFFWGGGRHEGTCPPCPSPVSYASTPMLETILGPLHRWKCQFADCGQIEEWSDFLQL